MSNYGPPGGPNPGQPAQPWPDRQPQEPYGQPSDPWGQQPDPWGGNPASTPPDAAASPGGDGGYYDPGYDANQRHEPGYPPGPVQAPWAPPTGPPPRKRVSGPILAVLVTLAVLVCGGGAAAFYLVGRDDTPPVSQPTGTPDSRQSRGQLPVSPAPGATTPQPDSSTDARFVKAGQCVKNEGDGAKPRLAITVCAPKTYEVLQRFEGTTNGENDAKAKCAKVEGYTDWYFFNSELDGLDFVLCLKLR